MCVSIVFVLLSIASSYFKNDSNIKINSINNSNIIYNDEYSFVDVNYPRLKDDKIDKIISDYIYKYVKDFRLDNTKNKKLNIDYQLYYKDKYLNIVFKINNTIDNIKYKNIIIDTSTKDIAYISNIFDIKYLEKNINELVYYKYSENIYNLIKNSNINNHTYIIDDNKIDIYFYDIKFKDIDYTPYVSIKLNENVFKRNEYKYDKYIAFTFDDGPTKYTSELLKTLELNNSSATFFMIGNRMKYNKDIVLEIYNSNSEVSSHTYSHKNLTNISKNELNKEINSIEIIYNEITNDNIKYLRPPYGSYNESIISLKYPLILWNIDPKDWLVKDPNQIYNNVIRNACDGCIVLLHDTSFNTIETVKKLIPALNNLDYNVVSISELINAKKYNIGNNQVIRQIK